MEMMVTFLLMIQQNLQLLIQRMSNQKLVVQISNIKTMKMMVILEIHVGLLEINDQLLQLKIIWFLL